MMRYNNNNTQQEIVVTLTSIEDDLDTNKKKKEIEIGLDFILSHLEEPTIFPRTIMTKKLGYHQMVYSKERALEHFIESDFIDCRINAFPSLKEGATWMPELLFIDLDLSDFNTKRSLQIVLNKILKSIKEKLDKNAHPTVLWSGNGYHIILPVYCPGELERIQQFQGFTTTSKPSEEFLRVAKDYLSNGKADKSNYPSFRSCLLRIPNSLNGKCLARRGESLENSKVKIIQEWNGYRPPVVELLYDFRRYLIQKEIDDYNYKQKLLLVANKKKRNKNYQYYYYPTRNHDNNNYYYVWIETILQTPFEDCRKIISSLILAPYLINVKKLPFQQ